MAQKNTEQHSEMKKLQDAIDNREAGGFINNFDNFKKNPHFESNVRNYRCHSKQERGNIESNNTILHYAVERLQFEDGKDNDIIEKIVKLSPDLLACGKVSETHKGQTPLHILIVRKQKVTLRRIKDWILSDELKMGDTVRYNISNPIVEGKLFKKTVMEGELPHIVAALTLDIEIAEIVIEMTKKDIKAQNSKGNTVYHCLVEYAARYPDDIQKVTAMWEFLAKYEHDKVQALGSMALRRINGDHLRPLQLAAKLGVATLFNKILESEKIQNVYEGLFDTYLYDLTVIDTVAHFKDEQRKKKEQEQEKNPKPKQNQVMSSENIKENSPEAENKDEQIGIAITTKKFSRSQSVLEMVCNSNVAKNKDSVYQIIRQPPVKMLIDKKWNFCVWKRRLWALIHLCIMVWYSSYAIVWSVVAFPSNSTHPATTDNQRTFMFVSSILCFVVCVPYLTITVLLIISRCSRPNRSDYFTHDLEYIVLLILFSFGLLVDSIWHHIYLERDVYFLTISVLSGWWFSVFFLRAFESISFYVAMIKKVIFGDLLRFGLFILLSVGSFSIIFQVLFQGSGVPTAYGAANTTDPLYVFAKTVLISIQSMFGHQDINNLPEAREPAMAHIVYLVYVIMTHLVLLNSLIAMISETCATVRENERVFYHTQRLYVILFLEEISYPFWTLFDCCVPTVPLELREKLRNNERQYESYFLSMTDQIITNENITDKSLNNNQQLEPNTETPIFIIRQPYLEEYIVNDKETDYRLTWKNEQLRNT